ncbi:MAG: bacillithiol transferase BstA [Blastocatellia bacterium]|nr:bacillithiol transferase BstA [Blastocatellia bacterium]
MTNLSYPIGKFDFTAQLSLEDITTAINHIDDTPARLRAAIEGLNQEQLETPYRPEGWTVRQVVHHVADSHVNAYIRLKLALTEETPTIKPYDEARWAELEDSRTTPLEISLQLLESLHQRWVVLLRSLNETDLQRTFRHPDLGNLTVSQLIGLYSWHSRHHTAHITGLRERNNW